ncbi:MAG: hypothetical protein HRT45_06005 [Bdellovibrionales bacterium]|nr:hypothetical protein [Bdellovibrionales bacterium]
MQFEQISRLIETSNTAYQNLRMREGLIKSARNRAQFVSAITGLTEIERLALNFNQVRETLIINDEEAAKLEEIEQLDNFSVRQRRQILKESIVGAFDSGLTITPDRLGFSLAEFLNLVEFYKPLSIDFRKPEFEPFWRFAMQSLESETMARAFLQEAPRSFLRDNRADMNQWVYRRFDIFD